MGLIAQPGRLLAALSAVLVILAAVVTPGFFNIDEVIYAIGVEAAARSGGFVVENGFERFGLDEFRVWFLQPTGAGLVSQYPAGSAFAGALLAPIFGTRALIVLNIAAAIGTLFVTFALARDIFRSEKVATGAVVLLVLFSFWPEYVFAHWPHSVSVFCTTFALLQFLRALPRETGAFRPAVWSGLAIGLGMLFRLDGVLLAAGIAVVAALWAVRPVAVLAGGAVGLVPMLGVLAATNHAKFDTWNPLTYGGSGGETDLTTHIGTVGILAVGFAALFVLRLLPPVGPRARRLLLLAVPAGMVALLLTPLAPYVWKLLNGTRAILLDATAIIDTRSGVQPQPDGTQLFWGLPKKALFQSMPWLGVLAFLASGRKSLPRAAIVVLIVAAVWTLPFLMRSWHGGYGSNMRYLLPVVPALAAVASFALVQLAESLPKGPDTLRLGLAVALALVLLAGLVAPDLGGRIHQVYSTWLFLAVFAATLAAGLVDRRALSRAALAVTGASLGLGLFLNGSDFITSQNLRARNHDSAEAVAQVPGPVIFYGPPEFYGSAIGDPERLLALPFAPGGKNAFDPDLIEKACAAGYRLVMWDLLAGTTGLPKERFAVVELPASTRSEKLVEVTCQ